MLHATNSDAQNLVRHVRTAMKMTRFLVIATDPAASYLYGSTISNEHALQLAKADHPFATLTQEIEYLPPEVLATLPKPPLDAQIERLGRVLPGSVT